MQLHDRYMNFPTIDFQHLYSINLFGTINLSYKIIQAYNEEITTGYCNFKKLEALRIVLCYEYQNAVKIKKPLEVSQIIPIEMKMEFLLKLSQEELSIFQDVFILQAVLFHDTNDLLKNLIKFQESIDTNILENSDLLIIYMKIIESFLDAFHLQLLIRNENYEEKLQKKKILAKVILEDIKMWLYKIENAKWTFFPTFLSKLITAVGKENILPQLWNLILTKMNHSQNLLSILCIIIDMWFPLDSDSTIDISYDHCFNKELWPLLLQKLKSPIQYIRKQVLYLIKKIIQIINKSVKLDTKGENVPFYCKEDKQGDLSIKNLQNTFILILEALEEKQKHLIIPVLPSLKILMAGCREHHSCGNCFNIVWVYAVFERILKHENSSIMKQGLINALKMDSDLYNDEFITLLANSLNNTSLYKYENEKQPEIVTKLLDLFARDMSLIPRFLLAFAQISWGPIAIYHVTSAIKTVPTRVTQEPFYWDKDCLNAIKCLIENNLGKHSKILRFASQMNIIQAITFFIDEPHLLLIEIGLSVFPKDEALCRGTFSWTIIKNWLTKYNQTTKAQQLVTELYKLLENYKDFALSIDSISTLIVLLYDSELIFQNNDCPVKKTLCTLFQHLNSIYARPYADITLTIRIFELVCHLLNQFSKDQKVYDWILPYIDLGVAFVLTKLKNSTGLRYENIEKLMMIATVCMSRTKDKNSLNHLRSECILVLVKTTDCNGIQRLFGMQILYLCEKVIVENFNRNFESCENNECMNSLLNNYRIPMHFDNGGEIVVSKGKVVSEYYAYVIKFIILHLKKHTKMENVDWLQHISVLLDSTGKEIVPLVLEMLYGIIRKNMFDKENDLLRLEELIKLCWKCTLHCKKSSFFLIAVDWMVEIIRILASKRLKKSWSLLQEVTQEILNEGDRIPILKKFVLSRVLSFDIEFIKDILIDCLLHGPVIRQDQKIEIQTCETIMQEYASENLNYLQSSIISYLNVNMDAVVRAQAVIMLHFMIFQDNNLCNQIFFALVEKLENIKTKRYFGDSYVHRINHRILQLLLSLHHQWNEACIEVLHDLLYKMVVSDNHQSSVQLMINWLLTRIYTEDKKYRNNIWNLFNEVKEKRPDSLHFVLVIINHILDHLLLNWIEVDFLEKAIKCIAICCMKNNIVLRMYGQMIFIHIYGILKKMKKRSNIFNDLCIMYEGMYLTCCDWRNNKNVKVDSNKYIHSFYMNMFHMEHFFSLETIYYHVSRLTNVCSEEWIRPEIFNELGFYKNANKLPSNNLDIVLSSLSLYDQCDIIRNVKTPQYILRFQEGTSMRVDEMMNDMQKKAIPWKTIVPFNDELAEFQHASEQRQKVMNSESGFIVVASLVNRLPNLGGIARTCEIFGARELVISNHKHMQNKEFQNLSVSAERWINITEVRHYQLPEYLMNKKELGWSLIGAEQTVNSISLTDMKFEKQTILVLGNEKDGIPANLIPLLDKCVEIPQVGITRSLNVHVTSAICLWQYASQYIFK